MTTGSYTDDRLWYYNAYPSGYVGLYQWKTWNGADRPQVEPQPPQIEHVTVQGRDGSWRLKKVVRRSRPPKRARNPENPYTCSWLYASYPVLYGFTRYPDNSGQAGIQGASSTLCADIPAPQLWDSDDDYKLLNKLRTRLQGSDFNLGVFLAEGNQALEMIADNARRIGKAIEYTRRGNFLAAQRALVNGSGRKLKSKKDDAAGAWLEMAYGWKPLLSDTKAAAETLAHKLNVPMQQVYRVSRTRANNEPARLASDPSGTGDSGPAFAESYSLTSKHIKAIVSEVDPYKLIGLTDPASVAWEKMPWSLFSTGSFPLATSSPLAAWQTLSQVLLSLLRRSSRTPGG